MKRAFLTASVLFAATTVIGAAHASPGTLVVDKDKVQCPKADFTSIQAAVTAAQPGDKIKVCPDLYNEDVTVNKPLTLQATSKPDVDSCSTPAPADPTQNAIVTGVTSSFTLLANDITLDGFVVQGNSTVGIRTSDAFSGYLIRENVVQSNDFSGINFLSSGTRESRVTHNCLRLNAFDGLASEVSAEGANLDNARVDHNFAIDNAVGIDPSGAGARVNVVLEHNESLGNIIGYAISNSTGSAIVHNSSEGDFFGIDVAGANVGLDVGHNTVLAGARDGIVVTIFGSFPVFPAPSSNVDISHNFVENRGRIGIGVAPISLVDSTIAYNKTLDNASDGIRLGRGNTGNEVANNQSDRNGRDGIRALTGATGNTFENNSMFDNVEFDARDDNRPFNTWVNNHCLTDFPPGTICGV